MDFSLKKMCLMELLKPMENSIIYDTSSSSSDDEDAEERNFHIRINNYVEATVHQYTNVDFKSHFRMERATTKILIDLYGACCSHTVSRRGGWPGISAEKAVLLTIWYLANTETFRQISDRFNVTLSCAHRIVTLVTEFIVSISKNYINWPDARSAQKDCIHFGRKQGIQNIVGAIDGTHIQINRPKVHQEDYCNRKGFHSIILQGVVNSSMMFINIHVGEPGSMHDARVLRRSSLYRKAVDNPIELFYEKYKLIGDSAYPSLPWLLTPIKDNGHLTDYEKDFNYRHSSTRIVIENTYGHLKGRFRRLQKFDNLKISFIVNCTVAACVLHNICRTVKDENVEVFVDRDE